MAKRRELKPWHYQVTTALAVVTLVCVIAFFYQTFRIFFLTEHDPVLIAIERIKEKAEERQGDPAGTGTTSTNAPAE